MTLRGLGTGRGQGNARIIEEDVEVGFSGLKGLNGGFDRDEIGKFEEKIMEGSGLERFVVVLCRLGDVRDSLLTLFFGAGGEVDLAAGLV